MKKSIRTLSIGNSFSQDACGYIHAQAESMGIAFETVNLYIGGCSLATHWENWEGDLCNYYHELNGEGTGKMVSIKEALSDGTYDAVTLQQASHFSGKRETYYPYIEKLAAVVREYQPEAKLLIHQTWAYETDSSHGSFPQYNRDQKLMYHQLRECYAEAAEKLADGILPVGDAVQYFRENVPEFDYAAGGHSMNRDGFHLSIPYGRYLAGLLWIRIITRMITGEAADIASCPLLPLCGSEPCDAALIGTIRSNLNTFCEKNAL